MTNTKHKALVDAAANDLARGISIRSSFSSFQRLQTIKVMRMYDVIEYDTNKTLGGMSPNDR